MSPLSVCRWGVSLAGAVLGLLSALPCGAEAETYYVDQAAGRDTFAGTAPEQAFQTIQKACDIVQPGDTVIVAPGVYFENLRLRTAGTKGRPITFRADRVAPSGVIITGADPAIRRRDVAWQLVDPALNLYAIPCAEKPERVLYDNVDLLPYPSLDNLKAFRFDNGYPGTRHGFAHADGMLYVRLHDGGRYGSADPSDHVMAAGPAGSRSSGANVRVQGGRDSLWALQTPGPSHVVLDGFTFETPGIAAVYAPAGDVTVRNCWFLGCRSGVAGRPTEADTARNTNRVTIEHCDYSQFPAFDDMLEVIALHRDDPWRGNRGKLMQRIYWWQRKGDQPGGGIGYDNTYETGLATDIGNDWVLRANHIHDAMEALSMWGTDHSTNLVVEGNRIERIIDNAVECENRAVNLSFHHNTVVDVFEPFSWQPLRATPWPGPVRLFANTVSTTPEVQGVWKQAGHTPGIWKLGASDKNWQRRDIHLDPAEPVRVPGEGFRSYGNIIYCPGSVALTRVQSARRPFENFALSDNFFVLDDLSTSATDTFANIRFAGNTGVFLAPKGPAAQAFTGEGGELLAPNTESESAPQISAPDGVAVLMNLARASGKYPGGFAPSPAGPLTEEPAPSVHAAAEATTPKPDTAQP